MLCCVDAGFEAIHATALNAAINGSIFAVPEACLVMMLALPFGSARVLPTIQLAPLSHEHHQELEQIHEVDVEAERAEDGDLFCLSVPHASANCSLIFWVS